MQAIAALALDMPEYEAAIDFYVRVMRFDLSEGVDQGRKRWVRVSPPGGRGDSLILVRAEGKRQKQADPAEDRVLLVLETDDFDRDYAKMLSSGVEFEEKPRREGSGRAAVWHDPFGNRWDLLERA